MHHKHPAQLAVTAGTPQSTPEAAVGTDCLRVPALNIGGQWGNAGKARADCRECKAGGKEEKGGALLECRGRLKRTLQSVAHW